MPVRTTDGLIRSAAEEAAEREFKRELWRIERLAEQQADENPPEVRIRAWERMHGLQLPYTSDHPILGVIAISTRLSLAQVQQEQRLRAGRANPATAQRNVVA